ncbi:MAG TPA: hypothetical protein PLE33_04985 [Candidatus Cloacimonas sp.]|mgnify:CR=1 FL=1|nr:hypothetical protein [Candidatus Cloacimonas sp.]HPS60599.1 hypothetical protein [Candidatus Cloacimonas sp.]
MRKVILLAFILAAVIANLSAISNYALLVNGFEPSAINLAMGGSPVGVVNIWHNEPLNAYDNPAYPSLHTGLSYSNTCYDFMRLKHPGDEKENTYYASMMSLSYKGMGFLFPSITNVQTWGIKADYGRISLTDENGYETGITKELKEVMHPLGISVNFADLYRIISNDNTFSNKKLDLCLGMNYILNYSSIDPGYNYPASIDEEYDANCIDSGALLKYSFPLTDKIHLESVAGISMFNVFEDNIEYSLEQPNKIYKSTNTGIACSASLKNPNYLKKKRIMDNFENFGCLRLLAGMNDDRTKSPNIYGIGTELGFLDTIYLRGGYHKDKGGNIEGVTYGIGLDLHYRDLVSLKGNYSSFPGGSQCKDKNIYNFGCNLNAFQIISMLLK